MSDMAQGPGWWQASDGKWYAPEQAPGSAGPVGAAANANLADFALRAQGALVDFVGPYIVAYILLIVLGSIGYIFILAALGWGLYNAYLGGETGQSYGKKMAGIKLISEETGQIIGGTTGIVRFFAHIADSIICFIGYLFPLWDAKKQTLADKIMKTLVVKV